MNGFSAVLVREVKEQRMVVLLALTVGILALFAPFIPGVHGYSAGELRGFAAFWFAITMTLGVAVMLGTSVFARDLSESRTTFYFSRPLAPVAIWGGKVAASALLIAGTAALVLLPSAVSGGRIVQEGWGIEEKWLLVAVVTAVLFLLSNALSVALRSRSPIILTDIVGVVLALYWLWNLAIAYLPTLSQTLAKTFVAASVVTITSALAAGSIAQVVFGKADLRRARRALSIAFWCVMLTGLAMMSGYAAYLPRFDIDTITRATTATTHGEWIAAQVEVRGRPADYNPLVLLNRREQRLVRIGAATLPDFFSVSRDGKSAAILKLDTSILPFRSIGKTGRVWKADLARAESFRPTEITTFGINSYLALSDNGSRLAVAQQSGSVVVYDFETEQALGALNLGIQSMFFKDADTLLVGDTKDTQIIFGSVRAIRRTWTLREWDFGTRQMKTTGSFDSSFAVASSDGRRFASSRRIDAETREIGAIDAADGRSLFSIVAKRPTMPLPLTNERTAYIVEKDLYVAPPHGASRTYRLPLEDCRSGWAVETTTGYLAIACFTEVGDSWSSTIVDLKGGQSRVIQGVRPLRAVFWGADPRVAPPLRTVTFLNETSGEVFELDPETNQRKTFLGGKS